MLNSRHSVIDCAEFSALTYSVANQTVKNHGTRSKWRNRKWKQIFQIIALSTMLFITRESVAQCSPDVTAPVIACPANISTNVTSGYCSANVSVPAPTVTDNCQKTYSLTFAGGSQVVSVPNNAVLQMTGNFTIEGWFRVTTASSDWVRIIGKGDATNRNYGLWYSSVHNTLLFQTYATGGAYYNAQITFTPSLNTWYHVAGVKNGSTYTLYLNGVAQASVTGSNTPLTSTDPLTIGGSTAMHVRHIGQIDNVRLWNTAFSAAQISSAYNGILAGPSANLVAHYNMEANLGTTTLKDMGPNSLNGTLSGGMTSAAFTTNNSPAGAAWVTNSFNSTSDASGTYPVGTTSVVWTATDLSGNTSTCTQTVTVVDNISPTITCPANITVTAPSGSCNVPVTYSTPVATDNCSGCSSAPAITGFASLGVYNGFAYYVSTSTFTGANAFVDAALQGGQVVTISSAGENSWIRTNANSAGYTGSLLIGINDVTTEGTWVGGSNESVSYFNWNSGEPNNSGNEDYVQLLNSGLWNDIGATWAGNYILKKACLTPVRIAGLASGSNFPVGVNTVTYQATDAAGNSSTCSFTVTVNDVTAPTITCPSTQTVNLDASCSATMPDYRSLATVSDNCTASGSITVNQVPAPGSPLTGSGTISVTLTALDASGNSNSCSFNLIKADIIPPVITCNSNITVNADPGLCGAVVNYTVTATDECSGFCTPGSISGYTLIGTYGGHTYYKSNTSSNWATASAAATALGGHLVTINSSGENSFLSTSGNCWTGFTDQGHEGTWTWITGEPVTFTNWNAGEPNNSGGNENYMHVNYSVAGGWNDISGAGSYPHIVEFECLNTTMTSGYISGAVFPVGTTTVTYSATDAGGNTSTCSFTVTVIDNVAPSVASPNFTATAAAGECSAIVNYGTPMAIDNCGNCGSAEAISGYTALGVYNGYSYYISNSTMTPPVAFSTANTLGGQVATINSAAENTWIRTAVNAASGFGAIAYLIGQNDVTTEGTFVGGSGETAAYTNWISGEPNNSGGAEDYTQVYTGAGLWNDIGSGGSYNYILKKACLTPTLTSGLASGSAFPVGTSTVTYSVTDASGNTGTGSFTVTVSLNSTSTGKIVNPSPSTICEGSSANVNIGASEAGISYQLRINGTNAAVGSPVIGTGGTINLPTGIIYATTTYNILATNPLNGCSYQLTNTATVNVNPAPPAPSVTGGSRCGAGTVALSANPGSGNTTDWYSNATGGSAFLTGNNNYTTASISTTTTYYVVARNTTTGCTTLTRTAVVATVNSLPSTPAGTGGSRCGTGTVALSATPGTNETIDWYANSSGGTALATGSNSYTTPSISTTTIYYAEARNTSTGCKSAARTAVTATINAIPSAPTGTGASRCGPGSVTISASVGAGLTVDWYAASAGGAALLSGNTSYSPSITSTTIYYAETRNTTTGCVSSSRTAVTATMNALPSAPTGTDGGRCGTGTVSLSATPGSGQTIDWYASSSGGTALLSGNNNFTTPSISVTTVYYAQARNNSTGCLSATRTAITATVSNPAAPTAGSNSRCGSGAITITATPGTGETIDWYAASSGGTALLTGNTSYTPTVSSTTTYYAQARHSSYGCLSSTRTAVVATVNVIPSSPTGTGAGRCGSGSITITASAGSGQTIDWYANASGGTALSSGSTSFTTTISSTTTFYAEARNTTTGCVSASRTAVVATLNTSPSAPAGTDASRCGAGSITLNASAGSGQTIDWYANATGGTALSSGSNSYTTSVSSTTTFYAETRNATTGCLSATRTAVTATVNANPSAPVGTDASRCGTGSITISASAGTGETIDWYANATGGVAFSSASSSYTTTVTSTTIFYAETRNTTTGCISATRAAVTATVNGSSTIGLSSGVGSNNQTTCINNAITNITYTIGGSGTGANVTGLPSGVTGTYSAGIFTISGTPSVDGSFGYTVTTTGPCTNVTATGTLNISAATVPGTIADVSVCYGDNGALSLSGNMGSVIRWEKSIDNGNTWTNITNTTTSQSFSNATSTTLYRALVQNGSCGTQVYTANATVGIHNLWTGAVSSDWNNPANWSDGQLPTTSCAEVTIPQLNLPNVYPQITSGPVQVNNLIIYPAANLNVSNVILQVSGSITNNGTLDISNGTLELNGTTGAQAISGSVFNNNIIKNLVISNNNGVSLSGTNDTLKITGTISFGKSNCVLTTNGNLTLISNALGTASVADMTANGNYSGNDIIGNVNVERFIPNHPKAWQFLSVPTKGSTIKQAWQEGSSGVSSNLKPGYGTIITSNLPSALALGFDIYTPSGPTMKAYNPSTNGWDGVSSTTNPIANKKGYMVFVRGDRSVTTSSAPATNVVLRTTGQLYTKGVNAPDVTIVPAGKFESIGNPYPATIDFRKISKSAAPDVADVFYVWDPLLTNVYAGLGGYQTISATNGWKPVPGGTANYDASVPHPYILSGQAFFVHSLGNAGTVSFAENNKVNTVADAFRTASTPDERSFFRASMTTAADIMSDGNVVTFDDVYSNGYNADDAMKIVNSSENFGIKRFGINMAIEARKSVQSADTIFYNISNMRAGGYKLKFAPTNMADENLMATLVDKHLGTLTSISLSDSTVVPFTVSAAAAGSYAPDRFYVIFKSMVVLPVTISKITANRNSNNSVTVKWQTESEINLHHYEVERSEDGRSFSSIGDQQPKANNAAGASYLMVDKNASTAENYYRIKAISNDNSIQYSEIVKVAAIGKQTDISVFPNPVEDKRLNVHFKNVKTGVYYVQLVNAAGQVVYKRKLEITSPNSTEVLEAGEKLASGNYQLKLNTDDGTTISLQVIVR